jgi:hypothetical protein
MKPEVLKLCTTDRARDPPTLHPTSQPRAAGGKCDVAENEWKSARSPQSLLLMPKYFWPEIPDIAAISGISGGAAMLSPPQGSAGLGFRRGRLVLGPERRRGLTLQQPAPSKSKLTAKPAEGFQNLRNRPEL